MFYPQAVDNPQIRTDQRQRDGRHPAGQTIPRRTSTNRAPGDPKAGNASGPDQRFRWSGPELPGAPEGTRTPNLLIRSNTDKYFYALHLECAIGSAMSTFYASVYQQVRAVARRNGVMAATRLVVRCRNRSPRPHESPSSEHHPSNTSRAPSGSSRKSARSGSYSIAAAIRRELPIPHMHSSAEKRELLQLPVWR
jgi:hypothetical protein